VTPLPLTRLTRSQIEEMVRRVTGGKPLPTEVVQQIMAKTDGIPLFVEELVKTILEAGLVQEEAGRYVLPGPLPPLAIPATLQDALMARLDRLRAVKDVAQLGAVLGREFAYELLRAVASLDEATLQHGLAQLVEAELLYQRGSSTISALRRCWRRSSPRPLRHSPNCWRITSCTRGFMSRRSIIGTKPVREPVHARHLGKPSATCTRVLRSSRRSQTRQTVRDKSCGSTLPSVRHSPRCTAMQRLSWPTTTVIHGNCVNA
jgi:hypothetical protein